MATYGYYDDEYRKRYGYGPPPPDADIAYDPAPEYQPDIYQPESSDPYHTGDAYSTGEYAPEAVWTDPYATPEATSPPPSPDPYAVNQQAARENAQYEANLYASGDAYSTNQSLARPGQDFNQAAWLPEQAAAMGPPEPVEPIFTAPGRTTDQPEPEPRPLTRLGEPAGAGNDVRGGASSGGGGGGFEPEAALLPTADTLPEAVQQTGPVSPLDRAIQLQEDADEAKRQYEQSYAARTPAEAPDGIYDPNEPLPYYVPGESREAQFERWLQRREAFEAERQAQERILARQRAAAEGQPMPDGTVPGETNPMLYTGEVRPEGTAPQTPLDQLGRWKDDAGRALEETFGPARDAAIESTQPVRDFLGETAGRMLEPFGILGGAAVQSEAGQQAIQDAVEAAQTSGELAAAAKDVVTGPLNRDIAQNPVVFQLGSVPEGIPLASGVGEFFDAISRGDLGGAALALFEGPYTWGKRWQAEMMVAVARGDWERQEQLLGWANAFVGTHGYGQFFQTPWLRAMEGDPAYRQQILDTFEYAEAQGQNGYDAVWEFFQSDRGLFERAWADVWVDPASWTILGKGSGSFAARLGRLAQTSANPRVVAIGKWLERGGVGLEKASSGIDALADAGITEAAMSAAGKAKRLGMGLLDPTAESALRAQGDEIEDLAHQASRSLTEARNATGAPPARPGGAPTPTGGRRTPGAPAAPAGTAPAPAAAAPAGTTLPVTIAAPPAGTNPALNRRTPGSPSVPRSRGRRIANPAAIERVDADGNVIASPETPVPPTLPGSARPTPAQPATIIPREGVEVQGPWQGPLGNNTRYRATNAADPYNSYSVALQEDGTWEIFRFAQFPFGSRGLESTGIKVATPDEAVRIAQELASVPRTDLRPGKPPLAGSPIPEVGPTPGELPSPPAHLAADPRTTPPTGTATTEAGPAPVEGGEVAAPETVGSRPGGFDASRAQRNADEFLKRIALAEEDVASVRPGRYEAVDRARAEAEVVNEREKLRKAIAQMEGQVDEATLAPYRERLAELDARYPGYQIEDPTGAIIMDGGEIIDESVEVIYKREGDPQGQFRVAQAESPTIRDADGKVIRRGRVVLEPVESGDLPAARTEPGVEPRTTPPTGTVTTEALPADAPGDALPQVVEAPAVTPPAPPRATGRRIANPRRISRPQRVAGYPHLVQREVGDGRVRIVSDMGTAERPNPNPTHAVYEIDDATGEMKIVSQPTTDIRAAQDLARQRSQRGAGKRPNYIVRESEGGGYEVVDVVTGEVPDSGRNMDLADAQAYAAYAWPGETIYRTGRRGNATHYSTWQHAKRKAAASGNVEDGVEEFYADVRKRFPNREDYLTRNGTYDRSEGGNAWRTADRNAQRLREAFAEQQARGGFAGPEPDIDTRARTEARPPDVSRLPNELNEAGEPISPTGWEPDPYTPTARFFHPNDKGWPFMVSKEDKTSIAERWHIRRAGEGERVATREDAEKFLDWLKSGAFSARDLDTHRLRAVFAMLNDFDLMTWQASGKQAYRTFLDVMEPYLRREPEQWRKILARNDFPDETTGHLRDLMHGKSVEEVFTDAANRAAAAETIRPLTKAALEGTAEGVTAIADGAKRRRGRRSRKSAAAADLAVLPFNRAQDWLDATYDATEFWRKAGPDSFIFRTADPDADVLPGTWSRREGALFSRDEERFLSTPLDRTTNGRRLGDVLKETHDDLRYGKYLQQLQAADPAAFNANRQHVRDLAAIEKKYGYGMGQLADLTDSEIDTIVAHRVRTAWEIEQGIRTKSGKLIPREQNAFWNMVDGYLAFRRKMALYNPFGGPSYAMLNLIGNLITLGIARPTGIGDYLFSLKGAVGKSFGRNVRTWADDMREATGLGRTNLLTNAPRDQLQHGKDLFSAPVTRQLGKLSTMQFWRDLAVGIDNALRDALYRDVTEKALPKMRLELAKHGETLTANWLRRGRNLSGVTADEVADALYNLNRYGLFSAEDVRRAILDLVPDPNRRTKEFTDLADRLGRDWKEGLRAMDKVAAKEVTRVAFDSAKITNLDTIVGRVFMFHFWASRASALYVHEALKRPYLINAYLNLTEYLEKQQEEGNVPEWLDNNIRVGQSGVGFLTFMNLGSWFGTQTLLTDATGEAGDDSRRFTALGGYLEHGIDLGNDLVNTVVNAPANMMLNPLLELFLYETGALGADAKPPDVWGSRPIERKVTDLLNLIAANGGAFGIGESGERVKEIDSRGMWNLPAQAISAFLERHLPEGMVQRVDPWNPDGSAASQFNKLLYNLVKERNPDADDEQINLLYDEVLYNPDHPIYKEGLLIWATEWLHGLGEGTDWPDWLKAMAGSPVTRLLLDRSIYNRVPEPEILEREPDPNADEATREAQAATKREARDMIYSAGPEELALERAAQGFWDIGRGEVGRPPATAEEAGRRIQDGYAAIRDGKVTHDFVLNGQHYAADVVNAMSEEERADLAKAWVDSIDEGWELREAFFEARSQYLNEHPEAEGAIRLRQIANNYPAGLEAWVRDTRRINAGYDQYMRDIEQSFAPGSEDWARLATSAKAAMAINGVADSMYTRYDDDRGRGEIAYDGGRGYLDAIAAKERQADDAERAERANAEPSEYIQDAERDLRKVDYVIQRLDALDVEYGLAPGTSSAAYFARILGDSNSYIPRNVYDAIVVEMEAIGQNSIYPSKGGGAEKYFRWREVQPAGSDISFEAWRRASWEEYQAGQDVITQATGGENFDPAAVMNPGYVAPVDDPTTIGGYRLASAPATATATPQPRTTAYPHAGRTVAPIDLVNVRSAPGMDQPVLFTAGPSVPFTVLEERTVGGEAWALVQVHNGPQAWIRSDLLIFLD